MNALCERLIYAVAIGLCVVALLFMKVASPKDFNNTVPVYQGF